MKKNYLFTLSALLLLVGITGCNEKKDDSAKSSSNSLNNTSESVSTKPLDPQLPLALENAKKSVTMDGSYISVWPLDGLVETESELHLTISNDFYQTSRLVKDFSGREIKKDFIFVKGNDGKIYDHQLSLKNKVEDTLYTHETLGKDGIQYDTFCLNPFSNLTVDDFYLDNANRYAIKEQKLEVFKGLTSFESVQDYAFYNLDLEKVTFDYVDGVFNEVLIKTKKGKNMSDEEFYFEFTFNLGFNGELDVPTVALKEHKEEHDILKNAFAKLQTKIDGGNYTVHAVDADSGDHNEIWMEYDNYYVNNECFSDFKPALSDYKVGYKKQADGTYHRYSYYVSGINKSRTIYADPNKSSTAILSREQLDVNLKDFAPEFFSANQTKTTFTATDNKVIDAIRRLVSPFYDANDPFLVGTKVKVNLDDAGDIESIVCTAYDWSNEYTDDFTYTFKDFGTTVMPIESADK